MSSRPLAEPASPGQAEIERRSMIINNVLRKVISDFGSPGDDLELGLFAGCPNPDDPKEILHIASWVENEAPSNWGVSAEYAMRLAAALRAASSVMMAK